MLLLGFKMHVKSYRKGLSKTFGNKTSRIGLKWMYISFAIAYIAGQQMKAIFAPGTISLRWNKASNE